MIKQIDDDSSPFSPDNEAGSAFSEEEEDILDMSPDEEEGAGRANLAKYTSGPTVEQPRVHTDPAEVVPEQSSELRKFSADSAPKKSVYGHSKMSYAVANDAYFRELQGFVDNTLRTVAGRIAEKKAIELDTAAFKSQITKLKEDMKKEEQTQKAIQKSLAQEMEICRKREQEVAELEELLKMVKNRTITKQAELDKRNADLERCWDETRGNLELAQEKFASIKAQIEEGRETTKQEIRQLEAGHSAAYATLAELKKSLGQARTAEQERIKMLRQKSRILAALIGQESSFGKSSVQQDIYKILKSPSKQSFMMTHSVFQRSKA